MVGVDILRKALEMPIRLIVENAGHDGSVVIEKIKTLEKGMGYDASRDKYVNMLTSGIIDPLKVTRTALQNAASAAAMVLTTEAVVTDKPEPKSCDHGAPTPGMGAMGGMGGGMPMM